MSKEYANQPVASRALDESIRRAHHYTSQAQDRLESLLATLDPSATNPAALAVPLTSGLVGDANSLVRRLEDLVNLSERISGKVVCEKGASTDIAMFAKAQAETRGY